MEETPSRPVFGGRRNAVSGLFETGAGDGCRERRRRGDWEALRCGERGPRPQDWGISPDVSSENANSNRAR